MDYSLTNTLVNILIIYLNYKKTKSGQAILILFFYLEYFLSLISLKGTHAFPK